MFVRHDFMSLNIAIASLVLNIVAFFSTFKWQRKLQEEMAIGGYDDAKVKLLLATNWIRTAAFILLGILIVSTLAVAAGN